MHNTQPWQLVLWPDRLDIRADPERRLPVLDPLGRQLTISCGCVIFNARVSLAKSRIGAHIDRFPDPFDPALLARFTVDDRVQPCSAESVLDPAVEARQSNRGAFDDEPVPPEIVDALRHAAHQENVQLVEISSAADRATVIDLTQVAQDHELTTVGYRSKLRAWAGHDVARRDGIRLDDLPVHRRPGNAVPMSQFDLATLPGTARPQDRTLAECVLLLGTKDDSPLAWLRAGEGLERVLLEITRRGYAVSIFTQVIEVAHTRAILTERLVPGLHPHVLLRVGRARPAPATRRRRLAEVLSERGAEPVWSADTADAPPSPAGGRSGSAHDLMLTPLPTGLGRI